MRSSLQSTGFKGDRVIEVRGARWIILNLDELELRSLK